MPCNSGYMEPNAREIEQARGRTATLRELLDKIAFLDDRLRDTILTTDTTNEKWQTVLFNNPDVQEALFIDYNDQIDAILEAIKGARPFHTAREIAAEQIAERVRKEHQRVVAAVSRMVRKGTALTEKEREAILIDQITHRAGDMQRLFEHFGKKRDIKTLTMLAKVDLTLPLEPQLGFDPDSVG